MLRRAAGWLKPGGSLIYSVCSLEPQEGEAVANTLAGGGSGYAIDPILADELPVGMTPSPEGWLRIHPGTLEAEGGCDSFFVARFRRG